MKNSSSVDSPAPRPTFGWLGPGVVMAASGIGASDIVCATVGGATYGLALLWALALGAFFKFVLSEGLARWQLATKNGIRIGVTRQEVAEKLGVPTRTAVRGNAGDSGAPSTRKSS